MTNVDDRQLLETLNQEALQMSSTMNMLMAQLQQDPANSNLNNVLRMLTEKDSQLAAMRQVLFERLTGRSLPTPPTSVTAAKLELLEGKPFSNKLPTYLATKRHLEFMETLQGDAESTREAKLGAVLNLPVAPGMVAAEATLRWQDQNGKIKVLNTGAAIKVLDFLEKQYPSRSPILVSGPHGFGKSFALYLAVCRLALMDKTRVIYVPDCGGWASIIETPEDKTTALNFLLEAICSAFCHDDEVLAKCAGLRTDLEVKQFMQWLPIYCKDKGLRLFAIFDGHNGIPNELRTQPPFSYPERVLPRLGWGKFSTIVIAGTANNTYRLLENKDKSWPKFEFVETFTLKEVEVLLNLHNFDLKDSLEQVADLTGRIPLEVTEFAEILQTPCELSEAISKYRKNKRLFVNSQSRRFVQTFANTPDYLDQKKKAVKIMALQLSTSDSDSMYLPDLQVMYEANIKVAPNGELNAVETSSTATYEGLLPITPLIGRLVTDFYCGVIDTSLLDLSIQEVLSSTRRDMHEKGLAVQRYFELQVFKHTTLKLVGRECSSVTSQGVEWHNVIYNLGSGFQIWQVPYGQDLPDKLHLVDWSKPAIFIPESSTYPGVDFLAWVPDKKELLAIQISVSPLATRAQGWNFNQSRGRSGTKPSLHKVWNEAVGQHDQSAKIKEGFLVSDDQASSQCVGKLVFLLQDMDKAFFPHFEFISSWSNVKTRGITEASAITASSPRAVSSAATGSSLAGSPPLEQAKGGFALGNTTASPSSSTPPPTAAAAMVGYGRHTVCRPLQPRSLIRPGRFTPRQYACMFTANQRAAMARTPTCWAW